MSYYKYGEFCKYVQISVILSRETGCSNFDEIWYVRSGHPSLTHRLLFIRYADEKTFKGEAEQHLVTNNVERSILYQDT